jgi:Pectate lyase superfamily protein
MPSPNINTTDTLEQGRQKINVHFNDATQHGSSSGGTGGTNLGYINVKSYGALGTGSGGASQDQSGFQQAINAAGANGTVYIPPGNYYLGGGFNLGKHTRIVGTGTHAVTLNHTGNNVLFTNTVVEVNADIHKRRGFIGFEVRGNSQADAKGIVCGNGYGAFLEDLTVVGYGGTNGIGIEIRNSLDPTFGYSEGTVLRDIHLRYCTKNLAFIVSGGSASFSDTRIHNLVSVADNGHTAMYIGQNAPLYASDCLMKLHLVGPTAVGLKMEADTRLHANLFSIYVEQNAIPNAGYGAYVLTPTAKLWGNGVVYPQPGFAHITDGTPLASVADGALFDVSSPQAARIRDPGPSADRYRYIATLPASAGPTYDKLVVELKGGLWTEGEADDVFQFANRGGFRSWSLKRGGTSASRNGCRIVAYRQSDGSVRVYQKSLQGAVVSAMVNAYGTGMQEAYPGPEGQPLLHTFQPKVPTSRVPSGTLIFDSATAAPNLSVNAGKFVVADGPQIITGTGAPSDNSLPVGTLYLRKDGGASTTLYVKTGAATWTAK